MLQRLRSLRHGFWFRVSERVRWSRGVFHEKPARELGFLPREQAERIAALRASYQVQFESHLKAATSINNYEYLDILDRAWQQLGLPRPGGGMLCDVGCASFWYAATLQAFFRPQSMVGVEIEGHRLFRDGRSRIDHATGYLSKLPNAAFVIRDYGDYRQAADLITAWFPFLTAPAILAWRLPTSMLDPDRLFSSVERNLRPGGRFVMVNHGLHEAALAHDCCVAAGLALQGQCAAAGSLSAHRGALPVLSCWHRA